MSIRILKDTNGQRPASSSGVAVNQEVCIEGLRRELEICKAELQKSTDTIKALKAENGVLKAQVCVTWTDEATRSEVQEDEPPRKIIHARLPVELTVIISEFLLGDDAFGTLASLNTTCHVVHQETGPVLNETLVLDSEKGWWNEKYQSEANDERQTTEKIWSQTKYVISERGELFRRRHQLFPNLKVWIIKHSDTSGVHPATLPVCTADLITHKPVNLSTLAGLFCIQLRWQLSGSRFQSPIQGISQVRVEKDGHITGALDSPEQYLRFSNPCYRIDFDLVEVEPSAMLERTMLHLSRLMQPSEFLCTRRDDESDFMEGKLADRILGFNLGDEDEVFYRAVLPVLDAILARGIAVDVKIEHNKTSFFKPQQIVARMVAATKVYTRNFPIICESRKNATAPDNFFIMAAPQAVSDKAYEATDEEFQRPRTLYGTFFFEDAPLQSGQQNGLWVFVESGSDAEDNYTLLDQTIQP